MQNVGFAYCMLPALRERHAGSPEELLRALKRHLEFFNTHPAMAGVILGASVALEDRVGAGRADPRAVGTFKVGLMGSLGAIGDSFFWGALKPMASVAGVILSLVHPLLGIGALLLLYNLFHLRIRYRGFAAGARGEETAVRFLREADLARKSEDCKLLAALLGGAYAGVIGSHAARLAGGPVEAAALFLLLALLVHLFSVFLRKAVSPSELLLFLLLVGLLTLG
ncbi:MAG: hypothetical protein Kow00128_05300 [Deltaproteobacteria bacterium]